MLTIRRANERGHTQLDWLDSRHTFSFDQYVDHKHTAFGPLRVINEDRVAPGAGFPPHHHRDMEIITYVIDGEIEHKDNLGTGSIIRPGEIQKMSAGSGIMHSEYNPSAKHPLHLLQIWIIPDKRNLQPKYEQKAFQLKPGESVLLGSSDGKGLISIEQNVNLYAISAEPERAIQHKIPKGAKIWLQIVKGICTVNENELHSGDGAALENENTVEIIAQQPTELLLFEILV